MVRKLTFGIFMMLFGKIILGFVLLSVVSVAIYRWAPVRYTPLMAIRSVEQMLDGRKVRCEHKWVPLDEMSRHMPMAVIASEDNRFASHHGFDFVEIKKAVREAENGGRHRGASTISQQTAKNVFLWPSSSWVRKGFEAYFTVLIEALWSKERIMEVYLNSIETGDGLYGVEAVANSTGIPRCTCGGVIKPDVVLYEESLDEQVMDKALDYIAHADVLIIGGTSLVVYPAAGLVRYYRGSKLVVINKDATGIDSSADVCINAPIGQVLSQL